jgi:hypothetical protein
MAERELIASFWCREYRTPAQAFLWSDPSGHKHLIVRYERGGYRGEPEFAAIVPHHWTGEDVLTRFPYMRAEPLNRSVH